MNGLTLKTENRARVSLYTAIRDYGGRVAELGFFKQPMRFGRWLDRIFCSTKRLLAVKIGSFDGIANRKDIQYTHADLTNNVEADDKQPHSVYHANVTPPVDPNHIEDTNRKTGRVDNMTTEKATDCGQRYGYARASTKLQPVDRQVYSLLQNGVLEKNMYIEKKSGKNFNRPMYKKLLKKLRAGDVLILPSIDRLGRNYHEVLEQWRILTKEKRVYIVVLDMPLLDTRKKDSNLMDTFVADLVLQILTFVAQNERELMQQRQREGIEAAKRKGVRFGRPPMKIHPGFDQCYHDWKRGKISGRKAASLMEVAPKTFMRWVDTVEAGMRQGCKT